MGTNSKKVLLVGCGQLGSRHLQALASLQGVDEIHVVDSNPASLQLGQQRFKEIPDLNADIRFFWHSALDPSARGGDLCIIATLAKGREQLVRAITEQLGYKNFLLEKIVTQSIAEYQRLMDFCRQSGINARVHCQVRCFQVHQYIKAKLDPAEPVIYTETGGNHGLACNGIHSADLFTFYTGTAKIHPVGRRVDPILHPSRRGEDIFRLSGTLCATADNGSAFLLSFAKEHMAPTLITLTSPKGRFIIDFMQETAFESQEDGSWQAIEVRENFLVSHTTKKHAADILFHGTSGLPTLEESFPAHEYILSELLPEFNQLLGKAQDFCPVT